MPSSTFLISLTSAEHFFNDERELTEEPDEEAKPLRRQKQISQQMRDSHEARRSGLADHSMAPMARAADTGAECSAAQDDSAGLSSEWDSVQTAGPRGERDAYRLPVAAAAHGHQKGNLRDKKTSCNRFRHKVRGIRELDGSEQSVDAKTKVSSEDCTVAMAPSDARSIGVGSDDSSKPGQNVREQH